ncbi:IclR family transcriptional regulator [Pseudarthrobacter oxydans]|uniref:IclR family transcriptional regulator n=1 Tax=Pseudarthrobacter oxydans TaxID=1671 RepID=UPI003819112C
MPGSNKQNATSGSSARKVLQILLAFSEYRQSATVPELAEIIGSPTPTTYRYVALLKELHLLEEGAAGRYHPTANVMPIARAAQLSNNIARIAAPIIAHTVDELGETVMLMQTLGDSVVCIEGKESDKRMRYTFDRGHSIPMGLGATGKMALASVQPETQEAWLENSNASERLRTDITQARERQFATSLSELEMGTWAACVPVLVANERPIVLTMAAPAARISDAMRQVVLETLADSASEIRAKYREYSI